MVLKLPEVIPLLDSDKILVFGPRRSVGMLRFKERDGENFAQLRERMWKVVRAIAQAKVSFPSAKDVGEEKVAWVAFVKTKTARSRTAHISMVRRVVIALASEVKDDGGGVLNLDHTLQSSYDMDWNAGTIWCGPQKIASATHRAPRGVEVITMSGGWVDLDSVGLVTGCSVDVAKRAFELEL
ncbi:GIP [Symbiodinium necroappetens]|uniref:GIP protein n=1 Tax=Symbiodinium necroappetens TaxID=1628268 RepID=A0A813CCS9_9DINO|nr:GIP [Symbiodinium necroappetens]